MTKYTQDILKSAHKHSIRHKTEVLQSENCSCFYCLKTFLPTEIVEWTDEEQTALCPNCGIDSVIGDKSNYLITEIGFLTQMNRYWF